MSSGKSPTDSGFFEQLTLGLANILSNTPRITDVTCEKRQPTERNQITTLEQRHNVRLPDDMKRLYMSTDGFEFYWSYQYAPNDVRRVGYFNIPQLQQITLLRENLDALQAAANPPGSSIKSSQVETLNITNRTKIFELSNICDLGKVCLVFESLDLSNLKVFLLETKTLKFTFLAESFTEYLRMTIVHLGLPYWELCFSSCGLPPWTEQLFLLLAPHLLERTETRRSKICSPTESDQTTTYNYLDPAIFRSSKKAGASHSNVKLGGKWKNTFWRQLNELLFLWNSTTLFRISTDL